MHWDEVRGVDFLRLLRHRGNLANCNLQLASSNHFIATVLRGGQEPRRKLASLKLRFCIRNGQKPLEKQLFWALAGPRGFAAPLQWVGH